VHEDDLDEDQWAMLELGMADIKEGRFTSQDDFRAEMDAWAKNQWG
jgi:predicted transcriptional regulator